MKKILCLTDFSDTSDRAIAYGAMLCKKIEAELTLLHVQPTDNFLKEDTGLEIKPTRERLEKQKNEVIKVFDISCSAEVVTSNEKLPDVISQHAKGFDLIIMGTNGADEYYEVLFGSHSYQVSQEVSVPVMLIPTGYIYKEISTIGFAFDYEPGEEVPMSQLAKFATLLGAKVTILQVKRHYKREEEVIDEQIQVRIKMLYNLLDLEFNTIFSDEVSDGLNDYMKKSNTNVLALCSIHYNFIKKTFHSSVIKTLTATASYPIFIFHE